MRYAVERMTLADIPRVIEIEKLAYPSTWPASAYRKELQENRYAHYIVVRDTYAVPPDAHADRRPPTSHRFPLSLFSGRQSSPLLAEGRGAIVGFAGLWLMIDEGHITTIANHPAYRGRGVGELMLSSLIGIAYEVAAHRMTLEVRVSNEVAQNLYRKYGFAVEGRRRRYYSDNHEDAYVMGTPFITDPYYRQRFVELRAALIARLEAADPADTTGQAAAAGSGERPKPRGE